MIRKRKRQRIINHRQTVAIWVCGVLIFFIIIISPYKEPAQRIRTANEVTEYTEEDIWNERYKEPAQRIKTAKEIREYTEKDIRKERSKSRFVYSFENIDFEDTVVKVVVVILIGGVVFFNLRDEN